MSDGNPTLREYIETILHERDRLYAERDRRYEERHVASERAIAKAEDAQRDYNVRSNEFRGQLDDQAKTLMPRSEATALMRSIEDKMTVRNAAVDKSLDVIREDIQSLRESRSVVAGRGAGLNAGWGYLVGAVGLVAAIAALWSRSH